MIGSWENRKAAMPCFPSADKFFGTAAGDQFPLQPTNQESLCNQHTAQCRYTNTQLVISTKKAS
jgi:hypothetical protein